MRAHLLALALVPLPLAAQTQPRPPASAIMALRPCAASDLSPATDAEQGSFNGMSHSGTLLILRNLSPTACSVPAIPQLTLLDAQKKPLAITPELPGTRFMHPGPVVLPIPLAPGAEVTATMRWVSGPVYDHSVCLDAPFLDITIAGQKLHTQLGGHLCGDSPKGVSYELSRFSTDPVWKPNPTPQLARSAGIVPARR